MNFAHLIHFAKERQNKIEQYFWTVRKKRHFWRANDLRNHLKHLIQNSIFDFHAKTSGDRCWSPLWKTSACWLIVCVRLINYSLIFQKQSMIFSCVQSWFYSVVINTQKSLSNCHYWSNNFVNAVIRIWSVQSNHRTWHTVRMCSLSLQSDAMRLTMLIFSATHNTIELVTFVLM